MKKNFSDFTYEEQKDYIRKGSDLLIKKFADIAFSKDEIMFETKDVIVVIMTLLSNLTNTMFSFIEDEGKIPRKYLVDFMKKIMDEKFIKNQKE